MDIDLSSALALQALPQGVLVVGADRRIVVANAAMCALTGHGEAGLVGQSLRVLEGPLSDAAAVAAIDAAVSGGPELSTEVLHYRQDGTTFWNELTITPFRGGALLVSRDVTARKHAETALRETATGLELAVRGTGDGLWDWNIAANSIVYSQRFKELLGFDAREEASSGVEAYLERVHPDDRAETEDALQSAVTQCWPYQVAHRLRLEDGSWRWFEARGATLRDSNNVALRMAGAITDISARVQAEERLVRSEERHELALAGADLGAWDWNIPDGHFTVDERWGAILGYGVDELVPHIETWRKLLHPQDRTLIEALLAPHLRGDTPVFDVDYRMRHKAGHWVWIQDRGKVVERSEDGKPLRMAGTHLDITVRKQAEEYRSETNRRLHAATAHAEDLAARAAVASAAKSEFVANMSHELRTPINGVLGMIGLLEDTALTGEQRRYAVTARSSADALLALVNDILDFSKIEAGKLDLELLSFDLHGLLEDTAGMMAQPADAKGLAFGCVIAPDVPREVNTDPSRVRQILLNLVGNAMKFTARGEVALRVSVASETATDLMLRFDVHDTGIGIASDKLARLFTKFSQVDSSTTRNYGGTGLGLAISKRLAELMGGEVGVRSEVGRGSQFWFTVRATRGAPATIAPSPFHGSRVMLVAESGVHREALAALLVSGGMRCFEASDAASALPALKRAALEANDPFAVTIVDMHMFGADPLALARAIKNEPTMKATKLIAYTSMRDAGREAEWKEIGFVGKLSRPPRRHEMWEVIGRALLGEGASTNHRALPGASAGPMFEHARVLVAEDNITNQQVAVGILKKLGLSAEVAANGIEAVQALETLAFDVVLMDMQMPEMDGLEATRRIRDPQSRVLDRKIPIIALTANAMRGDQQRCIDAGMNDFVPKPVVVATLVAALRKWLPLKLESQNSAAPAALPAESAHAPAHGPGNAVFDRAILLERVMDDEEFAREVAGDFLDDMPRQIAQLERSAAAADAGECGRNAHKIKGACAAVGAEALRTLAAKVEEAGRAGDMAGVTACMSQLDAHFQTLARAITTDLQLPR